MMRNSKLDRTVAKAARDQKRRAAASSSPATAAPASRPESGFGSAYRVSLSEEAIALSLGQKKPSA